MPVVASQDLLFSHVRETTPGVTPATPAFQPWRFNSESLSASPNTISDPELSATGRSQKPSDVVGSTVSGDIEFILAKHTALDQAIEGVLANRAGDGPLTPGSPGGVVDAATRNTIGRQIDTFTIEKRWPNLANVVGTMDIVATPDAAPGASLDIVYTGGPVTGTGIVVIDYKTDLDATVQRVLVPIAVSDTITLVGDTTVTQFAGETYVSAVNAVGTVTLSVQGGATTIESLAARAGADTYIYQRFVGSTYSALTLTTSPNSYVEGTMSVVAGEPSFEYLPIVGATYADPGENPKFKAPGVIDLTVGSLPGVATSCWSSLTLSLDSQNREIPCIGSVGSRESALGSFLTTLSGEVYFVGDQALIVSVLAGENIGTSVVTFTSPNDEVYRFDILNCVATSPGGLNATGQNEDVTLSVTVEPTPTTVQTSGGETWKEGLVVSTVATAPTLP